MFGALRNSLQSREIDYNCLSNCGFVQSISTITQNANTHAHNRKDQGLMIIRIKGNIVMGFTSGDGGRAWTLDSPVFPFSEAATLPLDRKKGKNSKLYEQQKGKTKRQRPRNQSPNLVSEESQGLHGANGTESRERNTNRSSREPVVPSGSIPDWTRSRRSPAASPEKAKLPPFAISIPPGPTPSWTTLNRARVGYSGRSTLLSSSAPFCPVASSFRHGNPSFPRSLPDLCLVLSFLLVHRSSWKFHFRVGFLLFAGSRVGWRKRRDMPKC